MFTSALVLRSRTHGESDRILTFLTRDFGKVAGIAKGALRSKRRFVGSLEPFTHLRAGFRPRTHTDLWFLESSDVVRAPRHVATDLDRYAYSTYVLDLVDAMVEGREAEASLFDLCEGVLNEIDRAPPRREVLRWFEERLIALSGLSPRLEGCVSCGRSIEEAEGHFHFDPRSGSLRCPACCDGNGRAVEPETLEAVRKIAAATLDRVPELSPATSGAIRVLLQSFLQHHARRPLRSPALLRSLLA